LPVQLSWFGEANTAGADPGGLYVSERGGNDVIEMVARVEGSRDAPSPGLATPRPAETWSRVRVAPGVELHLRDDLPKPKPRELKQLVERLAQPTDRSCPGTRLVGEGI
jgi:hypothetical protein